MFRFADIVVSLKTAFCVTKQFASSTSVVAARSCSAQERVIDDCFDGLEKNVAYALDAFVAFQAYLVGGFLLRALVDGRWLLFRPQQKTADVRPANGQVAESPVAPSCAARWLGREVQEGTVAKFRMSTRSLLDAGSELTPAAGLRGKICGVA